MIGWKGYVGYYTGTLSTVSQIVKTDNVPFIIGLNPSISAYGAINYDTDNELYNAFATSCGDVADAWYPFPEYNFGELSPYEAISTVFPSIEKGMPNLYAKWKAKEITKIAFVLPTLGVVIDNDISARIQNIWDISGDSLTNKTPVTYKINSKIFVQSGSGADAVASCIVASKFDSYDDLITGNFYYVSVTCRNQIGSWSKKRFISCAQYNSAILGDLKRLFSHYVTPDIDVPENPYEPGGPSRRRGG